MEKNNSGRTHDLGSGNQPEQRRGADPSLDETLRKKTADEKGSASTGGSSELNEKSSTMGRRDKGTGLASKDGVTGSDYDGQLSE